MRRLVPSIAIVAILLAFAAPGASAAYPPGTFPGAAPGGAFRTVVMSRLVCGDGGSLQASYDQSALIVQIPAGTFGACVQVSLYAAETAVIEPLLPAGSLLLDSFAVGWIGPPAAKPITLTINDSEISPDATLFETTATGVALLANVEVRAGAVTVAFTSPPGYVVTRTAVLTSASSSASSGPGGAAASASPASVPDPPSQGVAAFVLPLAVILAIAVAAFAIARRRRSRTLH